MVAFSFRMNGVSRSDQHNPLRAVSRSKRVPMWITVDLLEVLPRFWQRLRRWPRALGHSGEGGFPHRHAAWPRTRSEFENFCTDQDAHAHDFDRSRLALYRQLLDSLPKHPCRLLNLGCGNGWFLRLLADSWRDERLSLVVGTDYAESTAFMGVPITLFRMPITRTKTFSMSCSDGGNALNGSYIGSTARLNHIIGDCCIG